MSHFLNVFVVIFVPVLIFGCCVSVDEKWEVSLFTLIKACAFIAAMFAAFFLCLISLLS